MIKHPKRPRDPAQLAKLIVDIATGEVDDRELTPEEQGKDPIAAALGKKGGKARSENMSAEERSRIAKNAAMLRWAAESEQRRDELLLKLLHTPPQPRPKRERVIATANPIGDERKKRPPSKGHVHKGKSRV